jgi:ankyrin repeat protein
MPDASPPSVAAEDLERLLFSAARGGDADAVLGLIHAAPKLLHAREAPNGWTTLHVLSRLSLAAPVRALIELGADTEARDATFRSALHLAATADAQPAGTQPVAAVADRPAAVVETLRALLKGGARVTARDSFGMTALHHAARAGNTEAVSFLLRLNTECGLPRAPIEAETNAEERALHLAAAGGHAATVRELLAQGAQHGRTNYLGESALHLAVAGGDAPAALETIRELVKAEWRVDLSIAANDGRTPLHAAAAGGHDRAVGELLRARQIKRTSGGRGVNLDARDRHGRTPADVARSEGFDDVAAVIEAALQAAADKAARAPAEQERALMQAFKEQAQIGRGRGISGATAMDTVGEEAEELS